MTSAQILNLIHLERDAIVAASFDQADSVSQKLDRVMADFAPKSSDASNLQKIKAELERNARLLEASIQGVKSARDRIATIYKAHETLSTYTTTGSVSSFRPHRPEFDQKA
jgi:small-conductance mechanosensitive channel